MESSVDMPDELDQIWREAVQELLGKTALPDFSNVTVQEWEVVLAEFNRRAITYITETVGSYDPSLD